MQRRCFGVLGLTVLVCLSAAIPVYGQRRGGQGGPGGGRGPGGGFGRFQAGAAFELTNLLRDEKVRAEVKMDDDVWTAVEERITVDFRSMFQMEQEEREKKMEELNTTAQETLDEVLGPAEQERLMGLLAQRSGYQAINNDLIAKKIELADSAREKLVEAMSEKRREAFSELGFGGRGGPGGGRGPGGQGGPPADFDPEAFRERMQKMQEDLNKSLGELFKKEEPTAFANFEKLKGEKFEFSEQQFGGGRGFGGFGGGRGRGGPGGPGGQRGGRGGDDN